MKKIFFFAVLSVLLVSCDNYVSKSRAYDELATQIRNDALERRKYRSIFPSEELTSVDVFVKKGEIVEDVVVFCDPKSVEIRFFQDGELSRLYFIYFRNGEEAQEWGKKGIQTNRRFLAFNFIYE